MGTFIPNLRILPEAQRLLWTQLGPTPQDFVLYGGTALALRLGHRDSVDFDFFSPKPFQPLNLARSIAYLQGQTVTQQSENTLSCEVETEKGAVRLSFFGDLSLNQLEEPDVASVNGIAVASSLDIFGMKCATIPQRNEIKDYIDIHALVTRAEIDLSRGIAAAKAIYGRQYNPVTTLQALSYFDDLKDSLPAVIKRDLIAAVKSVSLDVLPSIAGIGKIGRSAQVGGI